MKRRNILVAITSLVVLAISSPSQSAGPLVTVFKNPTCGCCGKWVEHLKANGFTVKVQEVNDTSAYEKQYRVPRSMVSCHTAVVNGYTIEGHVSAAEIKRLLSERAKVVGLAVPGMPMGSPGMEAAHSDAYSVFTFDESGQASVYEDRRVRIVTLTPRGKDLIVSAFRKHSGQMKRVFSELRPEELRALEEALKKAGKRAAALMEQS